MYRSVSKNDVSYIVVLFTNTKVNTMPLPLIPAIFLGTSAIAGVKGLLDTVNAGFQIAAAKESYESRHTQYLIVESIYVYERKYTEERLQDLGKVRLDALVTLGNVVVFLKRAKIKERELYEKIHITPQQLEKWEITSTYAIDALTGVTQGVGAGAAVAMAAYNLVGVLGSASTGTSILSLSGAAATSATLAWLGGGSLAVGGGGMTLGAIVLGGLITGPALLVGSFFIGAKAEEIRTTVSNECAKIDVAEAQMNQHVTAYRMIRLRIDEVEKTTIKVNQALTNLLGTAHPENLEDVYTVAKSAQALAALLDQTILYTNRRISGGK